MFDGRRSKRGLQDNHSEICREGVLFAQNAGVMIEKHMVPALGVPNVRA